MLINRLIIKIGNPLDKNTLVGPLIDIHSVNAFTHAVEEVKKEGGRILFGGEVLDGDKYSSGNYVIPAIAEAQKPLQYCSGRNFRSNCVFNQIQRI